MDDQNLGEETRSDLAAGRRAFLKGSVAAGGAATAGLLSPGLIGSALAQTSAGTQERRNHWFVPATERTVHWGYFSKSLKPVIEIDSGDFVTIETLTHHAYDDFSRMIKDDPGAESVYHWTKERKAVNRRGAGPMDASVHGRGPGEGFGVHICTGPVGVRGAEPGDVLEVRIIDVKPRPSANQEHRGK